MKMTLLAPVILVLFVLAVVLLPVWILVGIGWRLRGAWLVQKFKRAHGASGTYAILVYSESPNWQTYFEDHVFPRVGDRAVVLNWSERRLWKKNSSVATRVFMHFRPGREYNPYAMVFWPRGRPRRIEFFQAFRDHKHGNEQLLDSALRELFESLNEAEKAWAEAPGSARRAA